MQLIHPEVQERFYGCGSPIPPAITGKTVLDLGCGSGRDVYLLSALVGEHGNVIGVDMTDEQLEVAKKYQAFHQEAFGYKQSNVQFHQGYIEDLASLGIADNSVDLVVSNCVINLSPNKAKVFAEIFRVLKPGGELFFSDVFSDRRIPSALATDPVLHGECLGGALYTEDFRRLLSHLNCKDYRVVKQNRIDIHNPELAAKLGPIHFDSITLRAFKLELEDRCEDYGQTAKYLGNISEHPHFFELDDHHLFETEKWMSVCGNTASMLQQTRFASHFEVNGNTQHHFGLFNCNTDENKKETTDIACC